jgi:arginine exporter protein ArgO
MLVTIIAGIITGYVVSIPPLGPISFALISKGFKSETVDGLAIGFGAAIMDFVYCMIAFGGISLIISLLPDSIARLYSENISAAFVILTYTGCVIVIFYGIKIIRSKITFLEMEQKQSGKLLTFEEKASELQEKAVEFTKEHHVPVVPAVSKSSISGMVLMGILLCMSSLTLPASWIALVGYLKGYRLIDASWSGGLLFSAGAFFGTFLWFYTLLKLITGNRHRINPDTINKLNVVAGVILLLLGIYLFVRATISIFKLI